MSSNRTAAIAKIVRWVNGHKAVTSTFGIIVVASIVGGSIIAADTIQQNNNLAAAMTAYEAAGEQWEAAQNGYGVAVETRDAFIDETITAREAGAAVHAANATLLQAANGAKVDLPAVGTLDSRIADALKNQEFGSLVKASGEAYAGQTPAVSDIKPSVMGGEPEDYDLFTRKIEDDIAEFKQAIEIVEREANSAETFIEALTGDQITEAYIESVSPVITYANTVLKAKSDSTDETKNKVVDAANVVNEAAKSKTLTAANLTAIFTAVSNLAAPDPVATVDSGGSSRSSSDDNGSYSNDGGTSSGGGSDGEGSSSGGDASSSDGGSAGGGGGSSPDSGGGTAAPTGPTGDGNSELAARYGSNNKNGRCVYANYGSATSAASLLPFGGAGAIGWDVWVEGDRWAVQYYSC